MSVCQTIGEAGLRDVVHTGNELRTTVTMTTRPHRSTRFLVR
jgi:hypothetical protein